MWKLRHKVVRLFPQDHSDGVPTNMPFPAFVSAGMLRHSSSRMSALHHYVILTLVS